MQRLIRLEANPIIVKELRSRMRGARAFITLTGVLLLLAAVSYALFQMALATTRYSGSPISPQIGQILFTGLAFLELLMVCAITPSVTAGSISGEKEKLTYEMLLATPLRPASILWGKLVSALSYVFLLLFAAVPMASLVFIFGGVAPRDMLKALLVLITVTVMFGVLGLFMSALFGRTGRATVLSYLVVLFLLFGPMFISFATGIIRQSESPRWILVFSPLNALFSALSSTTATDGSMNFLMYFFGGFPWGGMSGVPVSQTGIPRPLYHYSLPLYGAVTLVLYLVTTRLVLPTRRWRIRWFEALAALGLLLLYGGIVGGAYLASSGRYENFSLFNQPYPGPGVSEPGIIQRRVEVAVPVQAYPPPAMEGAAGIYPAPEVTPTVTPTPAAYPIGEPTTTPLPAPQDPPGAPDSPLSVEDQAGIYAAVVRQLSTVDHTFGDQPPDFPIVYLVQNTDDSVGDPDAPKGPPQPLSQEVLAAVVTALSDLPAEFIWVEDAGEVPLETEGGQVAGGGAIIRLGNIHLPDGAPGAEEPALVSASLYFASLGAIGKTYQLAPVDGDWQVIGDTGVEWMS